MSTLHVAKTDDQRTRLLDVIEHDVRRLDRLVSDISNASRLDSELVKEDEEPFDLGGSDAPEFEDASGYDDAASSDGTPDTPASDHSAMQSAPPASATPAPPPPPTASTLFERMANLSRSSGAEEEDDEDDDGDDGAPALSIPRFLGRQNNQ